MHGRGLGRRQRDRPGDRAGGGGAAHRHRRVAAAQSGVRRDRAPGARCGRLAVGGRRDAAESRRRDRTRPPSPRPRRTARDEYEAAVATIDEWQRVNGPDDPTALGVAVDPQLAALEGQRAVAARALIDAQRTERDRAGRDTAAARRSTIEVLRRGLALAISGLGLAVLGAALAALSTPSPAGGTRCLAFDLLAGRARAADHRPHVRAG